MKHAIRLTLMVGVAAGALMMVWGNWGYAQGTDPNAAPNPYKMQENWAQLTDGRKFGQAIKVQVDHSDGKSIWVFDRCSSNDCSNSMIPPIQKFDPGGKFVTAFGANMFNQPHGFYVDGQGNVWVADERAKNGKGAVVVKFSPRGQVLMTLGKPGTPGNAPGFLDGPSGVVVAPNGDIYVADGHGGTTNDRIVKFDKDGKFITAWGKHGKAAGEFDTPHGIALDLEGRVYVADRSNSRIQVFTADGKFLHQWKSTELGRPWAVTFGADSYLYVLDGGDLKPWPPDRSHILKLDLNGNILGKWASFGNYDGQMFWGHDIAVGKDGAVYVGDILGRRVQKFRPR